MKHEELLAKIENNLQQCTCEGAAWGGGCYAEENVPWNALRTVVELHKPEQRCYDATCYCTDMCSKCKEDYPCSNIQAIEKVLV